MNNRSPGEKIGNLQKEVAAELGITTGQEISVAVGIIDAHAG